MTATRVTRYAVRAPVEGADLVLRQIQLAHQYRNDLVAVERGRRWAVRRVDDTPEVQAAIEVAKANRKGSDRKTALRALSLARKAARANAVDELARIEALNREIVKAGYNLYGERGLAWGTRLRIAAAADAARKEPLYGDDAVSPLDPHFHRWDGSGACVVQLQHGLPVAELYAGHDTRAGLARRVDGRPGGRGTRRDDGVLSLRVGSDGRTPIWARWPVTLHRALPDAGRVTWASVTRNRHGEWSCELTVEADAPQLPTVVDRRGAIAVEVCWYDRGQEGICAATWLESSGERGAVLIPRRIVGALRRASDIRSLRDLSLIDAHSVEGKLLRVGLRSALGRALTESRDALPPWLARARDTVRYWKSQAGFHALAQRWRAERCDAAREAYDLLQEWEMRDDHLAEYERGCRETNGLRPRKQFYQTLAREWAARHELVILDNRDLSREARWGEESAVRFAAAPSELREAVRAAFDGRVCVLSYPTKDERESGDGVDFCERSIDAWHAGVARAPEKSSDSAKVKGGAWARRKAKKAEKLQTTETARKSIQNNAE
jgi:hypothetical protein